MPTDEQIAERLRNTTPDFCALEDRHHRLDAELRTLLAHPMLTPGEELLKKRLQKEKLGVKDRMAKFIHDCRMAGETRPGASAP